MTDKIYTREELIEILKSYLRMIEHDNGKYPSVTLNDIEKSIRYVLKANSEI